MTLPTAQALTIDDIDQCLSELGMLSEPCLSYVPAEEREVLRNKAKLAVIAAEKRKERSKKAQDIAKQELLDRKQEAESITHIYSCRPAVDKHGNKVGKKKKIHHMPKKLAHKMQDWETIDVDEEDYIFSNDCTSNIRSEEDYYEEMFTLQQSMLQREMDEEEQLQLALELSRLEIQNEYSPEQIKDIRKIEDIHPGMNVEVVVLGFENTRQRTLGTVVRILSEGTWDIDGVLVELEYGIIGRVTGLPERDFVSSKYTLSLNSEQDPSDEELLWNPSITLTDRSRFIGL